MSKRVTTLYMEFMSLSPHFVTTKRAIARRHQSGTLFPKYFYLQVPVLDGTGVAGALDQWIEKAEHSNRKRADNPTDPCSPSSSLSVGSSSPVIRRWDSRRSNAHRVNDDTITYSIPTTALWVPRNAQQDTIPDDVVLFLDGYLPLNWRSSITAVHRIAEHEAEDSDPQSGYNDLWYWALVQFHFYERCLLNKDSPAYKRALAFGRLKMRELQLILTVKKYRSINKRYHWDNFNGTVEESSHKITGLSNKDTYGFDED